MSYFIVVACADAYYGCRLWGFGFIDFARTSDNLFSDMGLECFEFPLWLDKTPGTLLMA